MIVLACNYCQDQVGVLTAPINVIAVAHPNKTFDICAWIKCIDCKLKDFDGKLELNRALDDYNKKKTLIF